MSGYAWHPMIKIIPESGSESVIDLTTDLLWAGAPISTKVGYELEQDVREDVNRKLHPFKRGVRPEVTFTIADGGVMTDHDLIANTVNALMNQEATVYLSLDAGVTYREVVLVGYKGPDPLGKKPFVGGQWELTLRCSDVLDEIVPIKTGDW